MLKNESGPYRGYIKVRQVGYFFRKKQEWDHTRGENKITSVDHSLQKKQRRISFCHQHQLIHQMNELSMD
jgi:hypothetical protein